MSVGAIPRLTVKLGLLKAMLEAINYTNVTPTV